MLSCSKMIYRIHTMSKVDKLVRNRFKRAREYGFERVDL